MNELSIYVKMKSNGNFKFPKCLCNQKWSEENPFHNIIYFGTKCCQRFSFSPDLKFLDEIVVNTLLVGDPFPPKWKFIPTY